jgi:hypothetical protein
MLKNVLEDGHGKKSASPPQGSAAQLGLVPHRKRQGVRVEDAVPSSRRERRAAEHFTRGDAASRRLGKAGVAL